MTTAEKQELAKMAAYYSQFTTFEQAQVFYTIATEAGLIPADEADPWQLLLDLYKASTGSL